MKVKKKRDIKRKLSAINYAKQIGKVKKASRYYGISRSIFYAWIEKYKLHGEIEVYSPNQKPII